MSCKHYSFNISEDHRHHIPAIKFNNCVLCAAESGPMTQSAIGELFGVSKERINQIEHRAMKKLRQNIHFDNLGIDLTFPEENYEKHC